MEDEEEYCDGCEIAIIGKPKIVDIPGFTLTYCKNCYTYFINLCGEFVGS